LGIEFSQAPFGDMEILDELFRGAAGLTFGNIGWTLTPALRIWIVNPKRSSSGNPRVKEYSCFARSIPFFQTNKSDKNELFSLPSLSLLCLFGKLPL